MSKEIKRAIEYVSGFYPSVTTVIFNRQGQWLYCDENFNAPSFKDKDIDMSILEDAVDSVDILPSIFVLG